jgi:hypothetical protein
VYERTCCVSETGVLCLSRAQPWLWLVDVLTCHVLTRHVLACCAPSCDVPTRAVLTCDVQLYGVIHRGADSAEGCSTAGGRRCCHQDRCSSGAANTAAMLTADHDPVRQALERVCVESPLCVITVPCSFLAIDLPPLYQLRRCSLEWNWKTAMAAAHSPVRGCLFASWLRLPDLSFTVGVERLL